MRSIPAALFVAAALAACEPEAPYGLDPTPGVADGLSGEYVVASGGDSTHLSLVAHRAGTLTVVVHADSARLAALARDTVATADTAASDSGRLGLRYDPVVRWKAVAEGELALDTLGGETFGTLAVVDSTDAGVRTSYRYVRIRRLEGRTLEWRPMRSDLLRDAPSPEALHARVAALAAADSAFQRADTLRRLGPARR